MTTNDCINYTMVALANLKNQHIKVKPDTLVYELCCLFELYDGVSIEKKRRKIFDCIDDDDF